MPLDSDGPKKATIVTLGCQMNEHDSEKIAGMLAQMGYEIGDDIEQADLVLYNTCCVRANPERKVHGQLGSLAALKERRPDLIVAVCGCMMQQREQRELLLRRHGHVDLVFGTHNLHRLPELLARLEATGERVVEVWDEAGEIAEDVPAKRNGNLKAWVNIIYGCNNFCSYCIVPYVRGRERSRQPERIIEEVANVAAQGYKEVTLLGQNVNSYGLDLGPAAPRFPDLLRQLDRIEGIERIRFTTSHPKDVSPDLIAVLAENNKVCEHLHLPLQAGSDAVLARMNRGYTGDDYLKLVEEIRQAVPDISLTTDIMVGFPGETDEDFAATLEVVRQAGFDAAFTFIYSPRPGTRAAEMPDQVPDDVKHERIYELIEVQNEITRSRNAARIGRRYEVLVDGVNPRKSGWVFGRTRQNYLVTCPGGEELIGSFIDAEITGAETWTLNGKIRRMGGSE